MVAGIDFPMFFAADLFTTRRSGTAFASGNPYDPESLLSESEARRGLNYVNSRRDWRSPEVYMRAVSGLAPTDEILSIAPRRLLTPSELIAVSYDNRTAGRK